jgi:ADP-heptose:LPS heptosyltransferase
MHLAGLFDVPQISIFGLENPFQLSPIGTNKKFLRNSSQIINEVTADEVYELSQKLLRVKN